MSKEKDFKVKFKSGAEVLQSLFDGQKEPVSDQFHRWKLWLNWKEVVGASIAEISEPISYHHGTLWLWTKNSVQMQHLTFMAEAIKNTINVKFRPNYVKEIRLTLDRRQTPSVSDETFKKNVKNFVGRKYLK